MMQTITITKFIHSCLLVEVNATASSVALFDPGEYSSIMPAALKQLDDVFITHLHPDHMNIDLIKQLRSKFPQAHIAAPPDAKRLLQAEGITGVNAALNSMPASVMAFVSSHTDVRPLATIEPPSEWGYHYQNILTNPGDSLVFSESKPILALPICGTWASTVSAVAAVIRLKVKPRYIIPVHDWQWNDKARQDMYERLTTRFEELGIVFLPLHDSIATNISV